MPAPLPEELQQDIYHLRARGLSYQKIATTLGINKKTVMRYCNPKAKEKAANDMRVYRSEYPERVSVTSKKSYRKHKATRNADSRRYYQQNRESILQQNKEYYQKHKEESRVYNRRYYLRNQTGLVEYARAYRVRFPSKYKESKRRTYLKHKHKFLARNSLRRARLLAATPKWLTPEHLKQIQLMFLLSAALQRNTGKLYHVDHIVPLVAKVGNVHVACGLHVPWNLQVVPAEQNLAKNCYVGN